MGCSSILTCCCAGCSIFVTLLLIVIGVFQILITAKLDDVADIDDSSLSIATSYVSTIFPVVILIVSIVIATLSCFHNRTLKIVVAVGAIIAVVLTVGAIIYFTIVGYNDVYGTSFESVWTDLEQITNKYDFELNYVCCGYKESTILCGCYFRDDIDYNDCKTTCYDRIIFPLGATFFASAGGLVTVGVALVVVVVSLFISIFSHKDKGYYNKL